jgi:transposase
LTRFHGHLILSKEGVRNAPIQTAVSGGVPPPDGRARPDWPHAGELSREFGVTSQSIAAWVAQAAADNGKPLPGKDVLSTAEREELARLRRQVKRLEQERDILAKATAWFAAKDGKTSTGSTNS